MISTVEPLLMDTLYKGHNIRNLHIKDRFNGPKLMKNFIFSQYILKVQRQPLYNGQNAWSQCVLKVPLSSTVVVYCY